MKLIFIAQSSRLFLNPILLHNPKYKQKNNYYQTSVPEAIASQVISPLSYDRTMP